MNFKYAISALGAALLISGPAQAELYWSDFSLSYLQGSDYEVGDPKRQVLTVEHASGSNWGDNFFFLDHLTRDDDTVENYFELQPRLSLSYVTGKELKASIFKDFFVATQWEGGQFNNYMAGFGTTLDLPGFKYFHVNIYQVKNDLWDDDQQLSLAWGAPFTIAGIEFLYDGFLDWSSASDTNAAEMNFTSQIKWNAGQLIGSKSPFYIGMEYAYWTNKFGIKGVDERNPCLLIKWHF